MFFQPLLPTPCSSEYASVLLQSKYSDDQLLRVFGSVLAHVKFIRGCQDFFKPLLTERAAKVVTGEHIFDIFVHVHVITCFSGRYV